VYLFRRGFYYLGSLFTLMRGVRNWPVLFRLGLQRSTGSILVLRDGTLYAVRSLMDAWIVKETNLDRDYERHGATIEDGWNIVDIGAGLGDFTVFAARLAPHGRVFAYEPAPDSAALLEQNLHLNTIRNVEAHPFAVASRAGNLSLDVSGGVAAQYRTAEKAEGADREITVRCIALADLLAGLPGGVCDFLKIDAEGAEYDMLLNLDGGALSRVRRICIEYHEGVTAYSHIDLERHFVAHGWRVRTHPSAVRPELGFLYAENTAALAG